MNTRRDFLKWATLGAASVAAFPRFGKAAAKVVQPLEKAGTRPNILFFLADDWGRNASCYRDLARPSINDVIETPNIDRVAREGVLFNNAFMCVSSCTPSRASLVTGCYFWRCGKRAFLGSRADGWKGVRDPGTDLPGVGQLLQKQGWATSHSGKTFSDDWYPSFPVSLAQVRALRFGLHAEQYKLNRDQTAKVFEESVRGLMKKVLTQRKPGQPFCHVIGPIGPHREFAKGSGQSLWGLNPDALKGKLPAFIPDVPEVRADFADTLGEVLALDLEVGWIMDELQRAGELENTMIVLTGDNGINMPRGKAHCYDLSVRAPLMIRWPKGIAKPGRVIDDFVNLIDLAPTWLEAVGVPPPTTMDGRSLLPLLQAEQAGQIDPTRDYVVVGRERHEANARPDGSPYPMRAIRTADFLYIRNFKPDRWPCGNPYGTFEEMGDPNPQGCAASAWLFARRNDTEIKPLYALCYGKRPAEELYDLHKDPDQMHNVAADTAYADTKKQLAARLLGVLEKTHDPRLTDAFDKPPYVTEKDAKADAKKSKQRSEAGTS